MIAPSDGDIVKCESHHNISRIGENLSECQGLLEFTAQTQLYYWNFSSLEVVFLLKSNKNIMILQ